MKEAPQSQKFKVKSFSVGPLGCNCSLLWDPASGEGIVVDPGDEFDRIKSEIEKIQMQVKYIVHTHAHFDHVGASQPLHQWSQAPLLLHPGDQFLWENVPMQGRFFQMNLKALPPWSKNLEHEMPFQIGSHSLKTLHTPGHTPGSCCFVIEDLLFAGDTLFQNSIGRTDLWGGDFDEISQSIKDHLYRLDDDTKVICGHGPNTSIAHEKRHNPFIHL